MARIRSVHPGQWTDEDFLTLSLPARLVAIALRNEADDGGVFAWKPITLKMRLMPVDNVDMPALLSEIEAAGLIRRYEADGRSYGAIRNFTTFQRPKAPKLTHPRLPWVEKYVSGGKVSDGAEEGSVTEPVPNDFRNGSEIPPQMELERELDTELEGARARDPQTEPDPDPEPDPIIRPKRESKRVRSLAELVLDDELRDLARQEHRDPERELAKFTDWCRDKAKQHRDYRAAFRNWLRSDFGRPPPQPRNGRAPPFVPPEQGDPDRFVRAKARKRLAERGVSDLSADFGELLAREIMALQGEQRA